MVDQGTDPNGLHLPPASSCCGTPVVGRIPGDPVFRVLPLWPGTGYVDIRCGRCNVQLTHYSQALTPRNPDADPNATLGPSTRAEGEQEAGCE